MIKDRIPLKSRQQIHHCASERFLLCQDDPSVAQVRNIKTLITSHDSYTGVTNDGVNTRKVTPNPPGVSHHSDPDVTFWAGRSIWQIVTAVNTHPSKQWRQFFWKQKTTLFSCGLLIHQTRPLSSICSTFCTVRYVFPLMGINCELLTGLLEEWDNIPGASYIISFTL